jgi:cytoskeleton protein RodZ
MQTIGERLEEARKRKGLSIREAAEATKIRGDYLHKFESNQFDLKLPEIYVRGFLRLYGNYLRLPGEKLVNDYLALGLGEGGRPSGRGLNREIYGKMEITHTSASTGSAKAVPPTPGSAETGDANSGAAPGPARTPFQPRMPLGGLDRALLAKNGIWLGLAGVVVFGLVVWGVVYLLSDRAPSPAPVATPPPAAPVADQVFLVALRPVRLEGVKDRLTGAEVSPMRELAANERLALPNADLLVNVSAREAVQFEYRGQRYAAAVAGTSGPGTLLFTRLR